MHMQQRASLVGLRWWARHPSLACRACAAQGLSAATQLEELHLWTGGEMPPQEDIEIVASLPSLRCLRVGGRGWGAADVVARLRECLGSSIEVALDSHLLFLGPGGFRHYVQQLLGLME